MRIQLPPRLYFSYSQFLVYDSDVRVPSCAWESTHFAQGFARRPSACSFSTLLEFGYADVHWTGGAFEPQITYERVIAVPFKATSGRVIVDGPDEHDRARFFNIAAGDYEIIVGQQALSDDEQIIDLFVRRVEEELASSRILLVDEGLNPPMVLLETAHPALSD